MNPYYHTTAWLFDSQLAPHIDALKHHFIQGRYSPHIVDAYFSCIVHFAHWLTQSDIDIIRINETVVQQFLDDHLPNCKCAKQVLRSRRYLHAALGHLLIVLRANAIITDPSVGKTPVDEELRHFDDHMDHVHGLAPRTRKLYLCIVRRLLFERFSDHPVVISAIKPQDVRTFIACQSKLYSSSNSISALVSALRSYFRFRITHGDLTHHLIGVTSYPANWQLSSLPKTLSNTEVERLLAALSGYDGPSALRTVAIVHCALDLGLRSGEVANLGLDDINWDAATITLRRTKSRREDVMPLPAATGQAIANYLQFERPQTTNRKVFVRIIAPRDQPVGPDLVRKSIRQAYTRAGLPYTRAHLLRHTMANRLLESGSSLKEVADVLRHRSLNTTLTYAKLDSRNLAAVALPWPGGKS